MQSGSCRRRPPFTSKWIGRAGRPSAACGTRRRLVGDILGIADTSPGPPAASAPTCHTERFSSKTKSSPSMSATGKFKPPLFPETPGGGRPPVPRSRALSSLQSDQSTQESPPVMTSLRHGVSTVLAAEARSPRPSDAPAADRPGAVRACPRSLREPLVPGSSLFLDGRRERRARSSCFCPRSRYTCLSFRASRLVSVGTEYTEMQGCPA